MVIFHSYVNVYQRVSATMINGLTQPIPTTHRLAGAQHCEPMNIVPGF
jgi:hypothetical protein